MFRKNVASQFLYFGLVNASTGAALSGATVTVRRCIDGTFAAGGGTVTEDGTTGFYKYAMTQADTNGNNIAFHFSATSAVPVEKTIVTTDMNPYDAVRLGLTALPNAAAEAAGGLYTRGSGAGQINQPANGMVDVNLVRWLGTAASTPTVAGVPNVNVKTWNDLTTVALPLVPTTAGRTLDVSATGEAGIDWANIGSPTTAQNLSATNIDVDQVVASVSGAVGSVTGAVGSVTGAVGSVTGAVGSVTGNVGGNVAGSVGSVTAAVTVGTINANVITAASMAADVATEIRSVASGTADSGTTTTMVDAARTEGDTDYWKGMTILFTSGTVAGQARLITGFVPGTDTITFSPALTQTVGTQTYEILPAGRADVELWRGTVVNSLISGRVDANAQVVGDKTGYALTQTFPANFSALSITAGGLVDITQTAADKVWGTAARILTAGTNIVLAKGVGVTGFNDLSAAQVNAEADTALADVGLTTTITGRIDAAVSSRLATAGYTAPPSVGAIADQVWEEAVADHSGTVGSTAAALAAAGAGGDPWATVLPAAYGAGTAGKIIGDNLNATVSSRASQASVDTVDGIVDAILVDTAEIGAAGAGLTALATQSSVNTVDTVVDAIKAKTDSLTFTVAGKVDSNITHVIADEVKQNGSTTTNWGGQ